MSNVAITYMNPAAKSSILAMGDRAVIPSVSHLVVETAYLPSRTIFIGVLCIVYSALAAIELCELYWRTCSGLLS